MRITVDKIENSPAHAVTPTEVREALAQLPLDWISPIQTVRISASLHSWEVASFSRISSRLILCTRGHQKAVVFAAMLRELYSNSTQTHPIPEWRLSVRQKKTLDAKIEVHLARARKPNPTPATAPNGRRIT